MSRELHQILKERARVGVMPWAAVLVLGIAVAGVHGAVLGLWIFLSVRTAAPPETKVTWVTLPAASGGGEAGGSEAQEEGTQGERQRRVEEVAPESAEKGGYVTPNAFGDKKTNPVKGTNPDQSSLGKSPVAAKGQNPNPHAPQGAAGQGGTGGIGQGTGIPGLKATHGVQGGTGLIGDLDDSAFYSEFGWYVTQIQNRITSNWIRMNSTQGRVQIYFRIRRDGSLEGTRVEIPSGDAGLDQSAMLAVKRSDPMGRLPDGFEGQTLGVRFWFSYLGN